MQQSHRVSSVARSLFGQDGSVHDVLAQQHVALEQDGGAEPQLPPPPSPGCPPDHPAHTRLNSLIQLMRMLQIAPRLLACKKAVVRRYRIPSRP